MGAREGGEGGRCGGAARPRRGSPASSGTSSRPSACLRLAAAPFMPSIAPRALEQLGLPIPTGVTVTAGRPCWSDSSGAPSGGRRRAPRVAGAALPAPGVGGRRRGRGLTLGSGPRRLPRSDRGRTLTIGRRRTVTIGPRRGSVDLRDRHSSKEQAARGRPQSGGPIGVEAGRVQPHRVPADDVKRATDFYGAVFGWQFREMDGFPDYFLYTAGPSELGGGIGKRGVNAPAQVRNYLAVDSIEDTLAKVAANGGSIVTPKTDIGIGWYAAVTDTEGNELGIYKSKSES